MIILIIDTIIISIITIKILKSNIEIQLNILLYLSWTVTIDRLLFKNKSWTDNLFSISITLSLSTIISSIAPTSLEFNLYKFWRDSMLPII